MNIDIVKAMALLLAAGIVGAGHGPVRAHEGHATHAQSGADAAARERQANATRTGLNAGQYQRSLQVYMLPDVTLLNANARPVRLRNLLVDDRPVMLDFIFTTCATNCPLPGRERALAAEMLAAAAAKLRMISVSIDPENDTPQQLKAYAAQSGAGANWQLLTGSRADVAALARAFNNGHADKSDFGPLTLLRPAPGKPWLRIDGLASAEDLAREYRQALPQ